MRKDPSPLSIVHASCLLRSNAKNIHFELYFEWEAVLSKIQHERRVQRNGVNAPTRCDFCIAQSSAHSDAPMSQLDVTAGSITRARAGEEATHAEKQRERGTAFSTPFLCLPAAWRARFAVRRGRPVGEHPQGRPSRQAVEGSGKRETPAVVLSAAGVGNAIRSRSIVSSDGRRCCIGVDRTEKKKIAGVWADGLVSRKSAAN